MEYSQLAQSPGLTLNVHELAQTPDDHGQRGGQLRTQGISEKGRLKKHAVFQEPSIRRSGKTSDFSTILDPKTARTKNTRLGRAELGPYAHEKQMPSWLREMLEKSTKVTQPSRISSRGRLRKPETAANETADIIPTLARLCSMDKSVRRALLCSPKVCQISKLPREGSFCGYRNIQMMISYIKEAGIPGNDRFPDSLPTILELQNMIEQAWDMGYNSVGREETGGIRGTRKYIGTSEAQALFRSLGIQCETCSIGETQEVRAYDALLASIASYFRQEFSPDKNDKVLVTSLPPIYFQHQGHSLTIIGFEIRDNGSANLLVLDPMFKPPPVVEHGKETYSKFHDPTQTLKGYRRGTDYLRKYKLFEILKLSVPISL